MIKIITVIVFAVCAAAAFAQTPSVVTTYSNANLTQTSTTAGGQISYSGSSSDIT